jgi:type I restriction enzyme S subunit
MLPLYLQFNPQFFCYAIASIWSQNWLSEVTKGVAYTGINIRDLKRLPLPVPPYSEQIEIVRRVEALFKLADAIEKRLEAATKRADKLTRAILGKAFRGELVPTEAELARREGRTYEPASALLERIRKQTTRS